MYNLLARSLKNVRLYYALKMYLVFYHLHTFNKFSCIFSWETNLWDAATFKEFTRKSHHWHVSEDLFANCPLSFLLNCQFVVLIGRLCRPWPSLNKLLMLVWTEERRVGEREKRPRAAFIIILSQLCFQTLIKSWQQGLNPVCNMLDEIINCPCLVSGQATFD